MKKVLKPRGLFILPEMKTQIYLQLVGIEVKINHPQSIQKWRILKKEKTRD